MVYITIYGVLTSNYISRTKIQNGDEYRRRIGTKPLRNGILLPLHEQLAKLPLPTFYTDESKNDQRKKVAAHLLAQLTETTAGAGAFTGVEETTTKKKKKKNKRKKVNDSATPPVEDPVAENVTNPTKTKTKCKKTNNVLPQTPVAALSTKNKMKRPHLKWLAPLFSHIV